MKITSCKSFTSSSFEDLLSNFKLPDEIHFMSLDIEGSEKNFLESIDFKKSVTILLPNNVKDIKLTITGINTQ